MIKDIDLSITPPVIPAGETYAHAFTRWKVSWDAEQTNLIEPVMDDTINLVAKPLSVEMDDKEVFYVSVNVYYDNNTEEGWSNVIAIGKDSKGFKFSNTLIRTPNLTIEEAVTDIDNSVNFTVKNDGLVLYSGSGELESVSWYVADTAGNIIWKREKDTFNLTSIKIPTSILHEKQAYMVKCQYNLNTNAKSNYGKKAVASDVISLNSSVILTKYLYVDIDLNKINVKVSRANFKNFSWEVLNNAGQKIITGEGTSIDIDARGLSTEITYKLKVSVNYHVGKSEVLLVDINPTLKPDETFVTTVKDLTYRLAVITSPWINDNAFKVQSSDAIRLEDGTTEYWTYAGDYLFERVRISLAGVFSKSVYEIAGDYKSSIDVCSTATVGRICRLGDKVVIFNDRVYKTNADPDWSAGTEASVWSVGDDGKLHPVHNPDLNNALTNISTHYNYHQPAPHNFRYKYAANMVSIKEGTALVLAKEFEANGDDFKLSRVSFNKNYTYNKDLIGDQGGDAIGVNHSVLDTGKIFSMVALSETKIHIYAENGRYFYNPETNIFTTIETRKDNHDIHRVFTNMINGKVIEILRSDEDITINELNPLTGGLTELCRKNVTNIGMVVYSSRRCDTYIDVMKDNTKETIRLQLI